MGAWIKIFTDGSRESGTDGQIESGKASWSRGRLDSIDHVLLFDGFNSAILKVPNTNWHQFDRFVAPVSTYGTVIPSRVARVVQAEIKPHHVGMSIQKYRNVVHLDICEVTDSKEGCFIKENCIGEWITIVMRPNSVSVTLSSKGKMPNDDEILKQYFEGNTGSTSKTDS